MILENKLIEVRDAGTFIPTLAIKLVSDASPGAYLLRRAGYGGYGSETNHYVLFMRIGGGHTEMNYDPYSWKHINGRTMHEAHKILIERWADFESGDVLDVEFELGEKPDKKMSEAIGE